MDVHNMNRLMARLLLGKASEEEKTELAKHADPAILKEIAESDDLAERYQYNEEADLEEALKQILERISKEQHEEPATSQTAQHKSLHHSSHHTKNLSLFSSRFYRVAAVLLLLMVGGLFWYHREYTRVTPPVISEEVQQAMQQSREGGYQAAEIVSAETPDKEVITNEERMLYHVDEDFAEQLADARRITTYQDKEYWVTLDDGTLVHLNCDSRLIYPEKFGDRRDVILEGEAYFMVARDKSRQFVVHTPMGDVKVYGTEFWMKTPVLHATTKESGVNSSANANAVENANAKGGAESEYLVLVRGSVSFTPSNGKEQMLQPGHELSVLNSQISINKVDTTPYEAWNTGELVFADEPLESLLAAMSRWYHFDVEFANEDARRLLFTGTIDRYGSADVILRSISKVTGLDIEQRGNRVIIR